ncbi:hypothetical protein [Nodosilinea sp. FACHB-13]|uniref:hypothetical protein n=1 Tax=Cyanophyceae TaxID=3028117 RepID=UPI00168971EE|nr:hypothetical protein [Nodosilinea sp. FACHB-13]MBD2107737.1 hypothetical protein [Nodosilinea sp. FACHB-13]
MIIMKLQGGLGNQMFQYALGRALSEHLNTKLKLDLSFLLNRTSTESHLFRDYELSIFNIDIKFASPKEKNKYICPHDSKPKLILWKLQRKVMGYHFHKEKSFFLTQEYLTLKAILI